MEFDKSIGPGYWCLSDSTPLDDIAFSLLCDNIKKKNGEYRNQIFFNRWKEEFPYKQYYDQAKVILRNEKLNKIKNGIINYTTYEL